MKNGTVDRLWLGMPGRLRRIIKHVVQGTILRRSWAQKIVYIVGCQRSGTTMLLRMFDFSMLTRVFDEGRDNRAFLRYRLRSSEDLKRLASRVHAPVIVLKPLCESHYIDRFLARDGNSRAIWIYRHYADVANSTVRMWGDHLLDTVNKLCSGRAEDTGWRGERIGEDTLKRVHSVYRSDLSKWEAACLFWYIRNRIVGDLGLQEDPRVRIVRYSSLVSRPRESFEALFEFTGIPFSEAWSNWIYDSSVAKEERPEIDDQISALCESLLRELDQAASDEVKRS